MPHKPRTHKQSHPEQATQQEAHNNTNNNSNDSSTVSHPPPTDPRPPRAAIHPPTPSPAKKISTHHTHVVPLSRGPVVTHTRTRHTITRPPVTRQVRSKAAAGRGDARLASGREHTHTIHTSRSREMRHKGLPLHESTRYDYLNTPVPLSTTTT